jgi:hypothetical protein
MARYKDADLLKDNFCNACATLKRYGRTVDECRSKTDVYGNKCFKMRLIDTTPTADVVPTDDVFECVDRFRDELMSRFIDLCRGNDYNRLTLLKIDDVVCDIYDKQIAELKKKYTEGS